MNCQKFEDLGSDIAREQILDVSVRSEALDHSSECGRCAAKLEDEFAITVRLRNFASSFESVGAPAMVRAQLFAAFEERAPVSSPLPSTSPKLYWISAIAAVLLIVLALTTFRARQSAPANPKEAVRVAQAAAPGTLVAPTPTTAGDYQMQPSVTGTRTLTARPNRHNASLRTNPAEPKGPTGNNEIATDFLPVTYGGVANLADGGRMVRVELPRSAMASFGLPVNMDRANEKVKADVLVGVDGLAHAIRFVR